jgi:hypothetical protein
LIIIFLILPADVGHRGKRLIQLSVQAMEKQKKGFCIRNVVILVKKLTEEDIDKINSMAIIVKNPIVVLQKMSQKDINKFTKV